MVRAVTTQAGGVTSSGSAGDPGGADPAGPEAAGAQAAGSPAVGAEPDARFTLANERTFLAWCRTALALVVAGLGIIQLLPPFPGVPWGRHVLGVPLIVLGAVAPGAAYAEWRRNQAALRCGRPLPRAVLPRILAVAIVGVGVVAAVVVLIAAVR
jgi:putative membrane protein